MKHLPERLLLLLLLLLTATGCSYEIESDDCPLDPEENNVVLRFELKDKDAQDIFNANIDHIEVYAFDDAGLFVSSTLSTKGELTSFRGCYFTLDPGNYSFVAWANHTTLAAFPTLEPGITRLQDCFINENATTNCDALYYGPGHQLSTPVETPLKLTVPKKGKVDRTMPLKYAHKIITVLVKDYEDNGVSVLPKTELSGVWRGYDFQMDFFKDSPLTLAQQTIAVSTPDGDMAHSRFVVTSFDKNNDIILHIKNNSGTSDYQVNLNDYIDANQIQLEVELVIPIVIRYNDPITGGITIYLPSWGEEGIIPKPM